MDQFIEGGSVNCAQTLASIGWQAGASEFVAPDSGQTPPLASVRCEPGVEGIPNTESPIANHRQFRVRNCANSIQQELREYTLHRWLPDKAHRSDAGGEGVSPTWEF